MFEGYFFLNEVKQNIYFFFRNGIQVTANPGKISLFIAQTTTYYYSLNYFKIFHTGTVLYECFCALSIRAGKLF